MSRPPLPPSPPIRRAKGLPCRRRLEQPRSRKVALAYRPGSQWRNHVGFINCRAEIIAFLTRKWAREQEYRLIKEVWGFRENRMAVAYEWHDAGGQWFRSYGNEPWEFDEAGLMRRRNASINDLAIAPADRLFHWPQGRRPDDHPCLSDLGL